MTTTIGRCLAMSAGALVLTILLLAAGLPGGVLLVLVPTLVCVAMPLWMDHRDPNGRHLPETAQRAVRPPNK
jgi:hypothetical protein